MTADACRPGGNFAICAFAHARFSSVNAKLAGCNSFGARRRTDIRSISLMIAARGARIQAVNTVFPKRARGSEHVVADMRRHLDVVEDGKVGDGLETGAARIVHDQLQRGLLENITRYRMAAVVAVLFTQDGGILLQQPG